VAERDGHIVGTVSLYLDGRAAHGFDWPRSTAVVRAMAVAPRTRGLGVAQHLLEACIAAARDAGNTAIGLHTAEFMVAARALYERSGFRRRAALDMFAGAAMGQRDVTGPLILAYQLDLGGG
jgi:ribosomal protein S18 acetylase RimI-like enzyme